MGVELVGEIVQDGSRFGGRGGLVLVSWLGGLGSGDWETARRTGCCDCEKGCLWASSDDARALIEIGWWEWVELCFMMHLQVVYLLTRRGIWLARSYSSLGQMIEISQPET